MLQYSPNHCVSSFYSKWINSERLMLISCLLSHLQIFGNEKFLCMQFGEVFVEFWLLSHSFKKFLLKKKPHAQKNPKKLFTGMFFIPE